MGLFGNKISLVAPISGKIKDITEVDDITFSQKLLGDGVAIEPIEGEVVAPANGTITQIFHTKHAISMDVKGISLLIHIGMDTVNLKGQGFTVFVEEGEKVKAGQKLMDVDFNFIKENGYVTDTAIVIVNTDEMKSIEKHSGKVLKGQDIIIDIKK